MEVGLLPFFHEKLVFDPFLRVESLDLHLALPQTILSILLDLAVLHVTQLYKSHSGFIWTQMKFLWTSLCFIQATLWF